MYQKSKSLRCMSLLLAIVVTMTMTFSAVTPTVAEAASKKTVKSITLKIGQANITKKTYKLKKGKIATLKVYVNPLSAKKVVYYKSSNKKIATVSKSGKITAKNSGTAKITVSVKDKNNKYKSSYMYVKVYKALSTQKKIYNRLMNLKKTYPEGKRWGNNKYYYWKIENMRCYACYAYAAIISDKLFGKNTKVKTHRSYSKIKVGDHIRLGIKLVRTGYHSVIVVSKSDKYITVTEGNYVFNGKPIVHWGRKISKSSLYKEGFFVDTRY